MVINDLKESKDKSQIFLIGLTAFSPLFLYAFLRIIYDLVRYQSIVLVTGGVFTAAILIQGVILVYLGYWVIKVLGEK